MIYFSKNVNNLSITGPEMTYLFEKIIFCAQQKKIAFFSRFALDFLIPFYRKMMTVP